MMGLMIRVFPRRPKRKRRAWSGGGAKPKPCTRRDCKTQNGCLNWPALEESIRSAGGQSRTRSGAAADGRLPGCGSLGLAVVLIAAGQQPTGLQLYWESGSMFTGYPVYNYKYYNHHEISHPQIPLPFSKLMPKLVCLSRGIFFEHIQY